MNNNPILPGMLQLAVLLWQREHDGLSHEELSRRSKKSAQHIAEHGDLILFKSKKPGESAEAFNRLAEGIAVLSRQPGGVTLFGEHFEYLPPTKRKHHDVPAQL